VKPPPRHRRPDLTELAVAAHICVLVIGVSWAFGGNADWVRTPISIWGSVGIILSISILARGRARGEVLPGTFHWAWPIVALNGLVALSCLTPGFRVVTFRSEVLFMPLHVDWYVPSTAKAGVSLRALWLFDGLYFSCLNLALAVRRRHIIRVIFATAVGNALVLSVFGIVQKLAGSTGIFFGLVRSPQDYFFSSFVYDNHWGAFVILMMGPCIGLALRYIEGEQGKGFFRGPASMGLVAACLLATSVPLSGSRAGTLLIALMLVIALFRGIPRISGALRHSGVSTTSALAGIAIVGAIAVAGFWMTAGDAIEARAIKTREQAAAMWAERGLGSRGILYRDTLRMARDRPLFGWGMGSYPTVFSLYNSIKPNLDKLPQVYHDAHSDWLQSLAELGVAGTSLLGAAVALPSLSLRRRRISPLPSFLLCGCVIVAAYSLIEFPFGNVAVVLAWWLCFFGAIQYIRLTSPRGGNQAVG
jgi:O-antigen ligase